MKIALIGVGSFVFGPSALNDAIIENDLPDLHLALVDRNLPMAELMAGVGRRMAGDAGRDVRITTHADWNDALDGCDFVVFAAAVQLQQRFATDVEIIRRHDPNHLITEFGGIAGISYTLRQVALISQLARDIVQRCPDAWLLNSANPLPRVCEAARLIGARTAGFCSNSMKGYATIGRLMHGRNEVYPWPLAIERYEAVMAGSNHLTFLLGLRDRTTDHDVLAEFIVKAKADPHLGGTTSRLLAETGYLNPNGDPHIWDFLPPDEFARSRDHTSHGNADEREQRLQLLRDVAEGSSPIASLLDHRAWERPIDFAAAFAGRKSVRLHSLNLPNSGQIPNVRRGAYVETPADVSSGSITPTTVPLPSTIAAMTNKTIELSQLIVQAAMRRDRGMLKHCVERDPTVTDRAKGWAAMQECLIAHEDVIGVFP